MNQAVDPDLAQLCKHFKFHIEEAMNEIERMGYEYPIPCLDTAMKMVEHLTNRIESDDLPADHKGTYTEVLNRIITSVPKDWSMHSLCVTYVGCCLSVAQGKSLNEWYLANRTGLDTAIKHMQMEEMLNTLPTAGPTSLIDSLYPDLQRRVLNIVSVQR